jgi:hypothetical protein
VSELISDFPHLHVHSIADNLLLMQVLRQVVGIPVQAIDLLIQMVKSMLLLANLLVSFLQLGHLLLVVMRHFVNSLLHFDHIHSSLLQGVILGPYSLFQTSSLVLLVLVVKLSVFKVLLHLTECGC